MTRLSDILRGFARVRAVGAEPARLLDLLAQRRIDFWEAGPRGELSIELNIRLKDVSRVLALSDASRCELSLLYRRGAPLKLHQARRRYALWMLPLALLFLLALASMFVWRIDVSGSEKVSDTEIFNALEDCGIHIGCFGPNINSFTVSNRVLCEIPELKWLSVSVFGSRVHVLVRDRTEIPEVYDEREPVSVYAACPGIIEQLRAFRGKPQFINGQTVAKGELLISGAVPSTVDKTCVCHARGEVIARTWHEITVFTPLERVVKVPTGEEKHRFSLRLSNNCLKFYSESGISGAKCDNIIREYKLGIEGLFELPVSLVCESTLPYETYPERKDVAAAKSELKELAKAELSRRIGESGEVISGRISYSQGGGVLVATLTAECRQDIAAERPMTDAELLRIQQENRALEENSTQ